MSVRRKLEIGRSLLGEYGDQLLVLVAALVFAVVGPTGLIGDDVLTAAIAGVLSVLTLSLLRDRYQREELGKRIEHSLSESVAAITGDFPFQTTFADLRWTFEEPNGEVVWAVSEKHLRFIRNKVHALYTWAQSDGRVTEHVIEGKRKGSGSFDRLQTCTPFLSGRRERITISLQDLLSAGDEFVLRESRKLEGAFRNVQESVTFTVEAPTKEARLTVTWPVGRPLSELRFSRGGRETILAIDAEVRRSTQGKPMYSATVRDPSQGEEVTLSWKWAALGT